MPMELTTQISSTIDAPPAAVWEALTTPDLIRRWFFGVETETDWAEGSSIIHRGEYQGPPVRGQGHDRAVRARATARAHALEPGLRTTRQR
jgi:uncharacterized protein YndB with AHSA1/START domain